MQAFVVRPFGEKDGVDFDRVHRELIAPALSAAGIEGGTAGEIVEAGNIRKDMFALLVRADVVIADISIHNPNVFYALGVRHAVRGRATVLIRARVDAVPFDLLTERYLAYDAADPGASRDALVRALRATLDTDEVDSPVIELLDQEVIATDIARLAAPPADFHEEVHRAYRERRTGDLALLSDEAARLVWACEGLRRVGTAQFELASYEPASVTWERVRAYDRDDVEANGRLATIYQKLGRLTEADEAVARVLATDVRGPERAEIQSVRASNEKTRWIGDWGHVDDDARARRALESPWLTRAYESYSTAFADDRNHYDAGLNALALAVVLLELGARMPDAWAARFDTDQQATDARAGLATERRQLEVAVDLSLKSARRLASFGAHPDTWLRIGAADLAFLTGGARPARVAARYREALADAQPLHLASVRRQLEIYLRLGVLPEATRAGLAVLDELGPSVPQDEAREDSPARVLLFTGHRIDAPGRATPRFPAAAAEQARAMIAAAIEEEQRSAAGEILGIAGGASGGDILFHETCAARGIRTQLFAVGSRDAYVAASVQGAGPEWVERFNRLWEGLPNRVLGSSQGSLELPRWLRSVKGYSIWERSNRWMLNSALVYGAKTVTLIALWNGEGGDGPGGTKDMVETARRRGAKVVVLDARPLATP